jgi:hypothetical protein
MRWPFAAACHLLHVLELHGFDSLHSTSLLKVLALYDLSNWPAVGPIMVQHSPANWSLEAQLFLSCLQVGVSLCQRLLMLYDLLQALEQGLRYDAMPVHVANRSPTWWSAADSAEALHTSTAQFSGTVFSGASLSG